MDLNAYKKRLRYQSGSEAFVDTTKRFVESSFADSPNFEIIQLNGEDQESRVSLLKKDSTKRLILFKPETNISIGDLVKYDDNFWLSLNTYPNEIYPKAEVKLCNQTLKWKDDNSVLQEQPCVIVSGSIKLNESDDLMITAEGDYDILVQYNSVTKEIAEQQKFLLGRKAYEVIGIDDLGLISDEEGILKLILEVTTKAETDTDVADNDSGSGSTWGGGW